MVYLDSAATTLQKPPAVAKAMARAVEEMASPGRGGHRPAMLAAETVFQCRQEAAALLGVANPEHVVFTSNATHGLNIAIHSLIGQGNTVLTTGYEHNAVTRPLEALGVTIKVATSPLFRPDLLLESFREQLTPEVDCAVFTHVSNVFGYVLPVEQMAYLCRERGVPFLVDASQSAGCLPVNLEALGAAFIAMPGHKGLYGPQGTGLLLCGQPGLPLLRGGTGSMSLSQRMPDFLPDRLEAGTHNVCGIAGLLEGIRYVREKGTEKILAHERALTQAAADGLSRIPGAEVYAAQDALHQAGVLSFTVGGLDCEELGARLGEAGIAVRAGYHCAPYAHRSAGTLEGGTVRASFSAFNTPREVHRLVEAVAKMAPRTP